MAKLTPKMRVRVNIIAFLVLGLGLSYAMATQVLAVLQDRYTVNAIFEDAGGVFTNQEVTYRGVTVGQVGDLNVVEEGVEIQLLIRKEIQIPSEGVEARVMIKSAVGEQFVDLLPAVDEGPMLEDGDTIPLAQTSIPVSTQELLTTLEAVLRGVPPEDLKGAIDALGIGLSGTGPDIATIIESTADLAEVFAKRAPEFEGILRSGTKVGDAFLNSRDDFETAVHQLVTVSKSLALSTENIKRLMQNTNLTSDEALALLRENRAAVNEFLIRFGEVNDIQADHEDDLRRILQHLPTALSGVNKSFEPGTGMIRFGLVQDQGNPACSYGTPRRSPTDRSERPPSKNLRCGTDAQQDSTTQTSSNGPTSTGIGFLPGTGSPTMGSSSTLPSRMSNWSWTLFYLNGV
ncbi:MAG: phospholipid/cholesterol/gamma-HCH transport system substrate-binding protein [Actinomycetota bacterium]|jgi:phospholipid/cholesterol/gamma-HCH transport system substrate-binding protein|nr:phospholipid/cholesterol/gamma-HCH transport system substrate-binding protein [Actinomycetota bacterium]